HHNEVLKGGRGRIKIFTISAVMDAALQIAVVMM
ncbi:hypothetical protein A2U01_0082326, partial [Trifolium medium]|nr:hypothetical protein [Trifolium medium]